MSEVECTRLVDADRPVKARLMSPLTTQSYRLGCGPERQVGTHWRRSKATLTVTQFGHQQTPKLE
jgi:hypothetical protein